MERLIEGFLIQCKKKERLPSIYQKRYVVLTGYSLTTFRGDVPDQNHLKTCIPLSCMTSVILNNSSARYPYSFDIGYNIKDKDKLVTFGCLNLDDRNGWILALESARNENDIPATLSEYMNGIEFQNNYFHDSEIC